MSLTTYRRKRRFDQTPEPKGKTSRDKGALRFVVQKHQATRLHYDFRLEAEGVLKSWAVPKGPSLDPAEKRLAVMVEDHPLEYRHFEGTIPEGNYGAGEVIIWDEGTYQIAGANNRRESEAALKEGLERGRLRFVLHGQKLQGEFALVKLKRGGENAWLVMKKSDEFASEKDVTTDDRSVASGRTLDDVARGKKGPKERTTPKKKPARARPTELMPQKVRPMLATLVDEPFDRPGWLFEPKWDGYRAIAEVTGDGVRLYSRNHTAFEHKFSPVVESLGQLGREAVLDGEVVVVDESGNSQFQLLQNYQKTGKGPLLYYVFDLLYLDGRDLRNVPLIQRKAQLQEILDELPHVRLSEHVEEQGIAFFRAAVEHGLEGIIAKNGASLYREGKRSHEWLKIKTRMRQEAVIGGFTEPRGSRQGLGALVLGVYEGDELVYIGHTGGGLDTAGLSDLRSRLTPLVRKQCPFQTKPKTNAPVQWVAPRLVCEVVFQQWTDDGHMRQPIFGGLREDKPAADVRREEPRAAETILPDSKHDAEERPRAKKSASDRSQPAGKASLTNLDKIYWPEDGYTKGDLIDYYREIAPLILPYLHDRPESLHRHPNGITGKSFFQKDVSRQPPPEWVQTAVISPESGAEDITYLVCQDVDTLLYMANLGCIELNPWNSRLGSLDKPDYLVIDLDPADVPFPRVVEAAHMVRRVLEDAGASSYCKTSGKRGLHVYVPLGAAYDYDQARQFSEIVAQLVHQRLPESTSTVRNPALRKQRIYLDYLQNRRGQTLAAPYSVRPAKGATVSTPLRWSEVKPGLDPAAFTIRTIGKRLDRLGDLWVPVLGRGIDLETSLQKLTEAPRTKVRAKKSRTTKP